MYLNGVSVCRKKKVEKHCCRILTFIIEKYKTVVNTALFEVTHNLLSKMPTFLLSLI